MPSNVSPFEEALLLDERGDARAEELYLRAISESDSVADSYCNLGIIESKAGRTAKAFDCFTKSLEHDPRHFESHYNLANLYFEAGNFSLAKLHFELAAEIEPGFANLYFNLGLTFALMEDLNPAVAALIRYKELTPEEEGSKADGLLASLKRSLETPRATRHS
jgi:tetratricopeptide (TPR) repeat protein